MSKMVFDQIAEGMQEALAVARGEAEPYKLHVPAEIDVKAIRAKTGLSQKDFASTFGFGFDHQGQGLSRIGSAPGLAQQFVGFG